MLFQRRGKGIFGYEDNDFQLYVECWKKYQFLQNLISHSIRQKDEDAVRLNIWRGRKYSYHWIKSTLKSFVREWSHVRVGQRPWAVGHKGMRQTENSLGYQESHISGVVWAWTPPSIWKVSATQKAVLWLILFAVLRKLYF